MRISILLLLLISMVPGWTKVAYLTTEELNQVLAQVIRQADSTLRRQIIGKTLTELGDEKRMLKFVGLAEEQLGDVFNPMHDEGKLAEIIEIACRLTKKDNQTYSYLSSLLAVYQRNNIGQKATNFSLVTASGDTLFLSDIPATHTLVMFTDPKCDACARAKQRMKQNEQLQQLVQSGELNIMTVSVYGRPEDTVGVEQEIFIEGYNPDQEIVTKNLYTLPTVPLFYLLDSNKVVLVKNEPSLNRIISYLNQAPNSTEYTPYPQEAAETFLQHEHREPK